jgi:hypothetical protein
VTKKLVHALESPRPKARYYVTTPTYAMGALRRVLQHICAHRSDIWLTRAGDIFDYCVTCDAIPKPD